MLVFHYFTWLESRTLHSVELFEDHVDNTHPVWISWVKHVEYYKLLTKDSFSPEEVLQLDKAVYDSMKAFQAVPEYKGFFKPKMHFAAHASVNTLRMGPMRGYVARIGPRITSRNMCCAPRMVHGSNRASHRVW